MNESEFTVFKQRLRESPVVVTAVETRVGSKTVQQLTFSQATTPPPGRTLLVIEHSEPPHGLTREGLCAWLNADRARMKRELEAWADAYIDAVYERAELTATDLYSSH